MFFHLIQTTYEVQKNLLYWFDLFAYLKVIRHRKFLRYSKIPVALDYKLCMYFFFVWKLNDILQFIGFLVSFADWNNLAGHDRVKRQLSVSSDSKLLDDDIREEAKVILRSKKPPRPKSEVLLNDGVDHRRTKRFSAFGVRILCFWL